MDNDSARTIKVTLRKDGATDVLEFFLLQKYVLNLNQDDQDAIKSMFCALISILKNTAVVLELEIEESFDSGLMKEVANDYIKDLNAEIDSVRTKILNEYSVAQSRETS